MVDGLDEGGSIVETRVEAAPRDVLGPYTFDLPVESNSWVEGELNFLVEQRRDVLARWMQRGDFYEAFVRGVMRANGVPTDLFYLGMIESAFLPTARSSAGAVGFWQFMPSTARAMKLRVDSLVDERMDPVRSTRAAARYLRELRDEMGDWALAAASYNAGTGRISRGLAAYGVNNYWDLAQVGDLAEETKHYVPRLYAMAAIAKGRAHYGFAPPSGDGFTYDSIQVDASTTLGELARIGDLPLGQLRDLNPHLLRGLVPAGGYWVWVPAGRGVGAQRAWIAFAAQRSVRKLAIREEKPEKPEKSASAPARSASGTKKTEVGDVINVGAVHLVQKGDTLWSIARRYGVSVGSIQSANHLDTAPIQPGMRLSIPVS